MPIVPIGSIGVVHRPIGTNGTIDIRHRAQRASAILCDKLIMLGSRVHVDGLISLIDFKQSNLGARARVD